MRFIKENIITLLCLGAVMWYLFHEFDTMKGRVLFIAIIIVVVFGMTLAGRIIRDIIGAKLHFRESIIRRKQGIIIWVGAVGLLFFFGGIKFSGIWLFGLLLWTILIAGLYWIWIRLGGKKW